LGIGAGSRCHFWWYVAALGIVGAFLMPRELLEMAKSWKTVVFAVCASAVGMWGILISNAMHRLYSVRFFFEHLFRSSAVVAVNNLDYGTNLKVRIAQWQSILNGTALNLNDTPNNFTVWLFWLSFVAVTGWLFYEWLAHRRLQKRVLCIWSVMILVFLMSPVTPTGLDPHHNLILLPLACLLMGAPMAFSGPRWVVRGVRLIWIVFIAGTAWVGYVRLHQRQAHRVLHGGPQVRWDTMSGVVEWCRRQNIDQLGLGDTGFMDLIVYLSGGELKFKEVFLADYWDTPREEQLENFRKYLREDQSGYYLFRGENMSPWVDFLPVFLDEVRKQKRNAILASTFDDPEGQQIYRIYYVKPILPDRSLNDSSPKAAAKSRA
jgi:hypothetical protein